MDDMDKIFEGVRSRMRAVTAHNAIESISGDLYQFIEFSDGFKGAKVCLVNGKVRWIKKDGETYQDKNLRK